MNQTLRFKLWAPALSLALVQCAVVSHGGRSEPPQGYRGQTTAEQQAPPPERKTEDEAKRERWGKGPHQPDKMEPASGTGTTGERRAPPAPPTPRGPAAAA